MLARYQGRLLADSARFGHAAGMRLSGCKPSAVTCASCGAGGSTPRSRWLGDREEEGSDERTSMELTAMLPEHRCCEAEQAESHRACPPDEGELPEAAAV